MKQYIMLNTELRTKAKTDFEKDFLKLNTKIILYVINVIADMI